MGRPATPVPRLPATLPETARTYLRPIGLTCGKAAEKLAAAGKARRLAGGPWFFAACEIVLRAPPKGIKRAAAAIEDIEAWTDRLETPLRNRLLAQLARLAAPRLAPGGGPLTRPMIMGVIEVTSGGEPGGGGPFDPEAAVATGRRLAAAGADLLEVVAPSARLGADVITPRAEAMCILPVIQGLDDLAGIAISIDTRHAEVAEKALAAEASMISDGEVLAGGRRSLSATTVLRAQEDPADAMIPAPAQEELVFELFDRLEAQVEAKLTAGASHAQLVVDPGFRSAGDRESGVAALNELALFHSLGCPILFGLPAGIVGEDQARTVALRALDQGVQILRTHDVSETRQVLDLWERLIASAK